MMNKRFIIACLYFLLLIAIVYAQDRVTITIRTSTLLDTTSQESFRNAWYGALTDNGCITSIFDTDVVFYSQQSDAPSPYRADIITPRSECQSNESIYKAERALSNMGYSLYAIDGVPAPTIYPAVIKCNALTSTFDVEKGASQFFPSTDRQAALGEACVMNITPLERTQNQGSATFTQTFNLSMEGDDITRCQLDTLVTTFDEHLATIDGTFDFVGKQCEVVSYGPTPYPNSFQCAGIQPNEKAALFAAAFDIVGETTQCYPRLPTDGADAGVVDVYLESASLEENYCATVDPKNYWFNITSSNKLEMYNERN
eukprot:UN04626